MKADNTAKRYLQQVRHCDLRINAKLEELERLKALVTKITPSPKRDAVSGGGNQDKLSEAVAKIVDLEAEINREIAFYIDARKRVTKTIDKVGDAKLQSVLIMRYIQFKTFEQIAADMHYTYRWVCMMHGMALQAVEKIIGSEKSSF